MTLNGNDRSLYESIERRAYRLTILVGISKGLLFSMIGMLVANVQAHEGRMLFGFAIGILLGLFFEFSWYFRPNITHHKILDKRLGDSYPVEVLESLRNDGLIKMLQMQWFVKRYRQVWDI